MEAMQPLSGWGDRGEGGLCNFRSTLLLGNAEWGRSLRCSLPEDKLRLGESVSQLDRRPSLRKALRLFFVSLYLGVGFIYQWRRAEASVKQRFLSRRILLVLFVTGIITGIHFGSWIWSLQHTSLSHSLYFICSHPLIIVLYMMIRLPRCS